jgi:GTP cyclohydrolase III
MVTAPSAPEVLAEGEADGVLAGVVEVEVGVALRVGVGVGTTEDCGRAIATYATAATRIATISAASAAFRIQ